MAIMGPATPFNDYRCKNKLCTHTETSRRTDLICPECGFKTLETYFPYIEGLSMKFAGFPPKEVE
jgi:hypothetical protein